MKELQLSFEVRGLVAPKDGIILNGILFKRAKRPGEREFEESDDLSLVFFRKSGEGLKIEDFQKFRTALERILYFYGLIVGRYAELPDQASSKSEINDLNPFGNPTSLGTIYPSVMLNEKQSEQYAHLLKRAIQYRERFESIFENSDLSYLKNALVYYYKALEDLSDLRLEEALIDLMISLESLIGEYPEIRYKMSLRASTLLSLKDESQRIETFAQVHNLYNKRSQIVHGNGAKLSYKEIFDFTKTVQKAILILLNLSKPRKSIIALIDASILSPEKRKELESLTQNILFSAL
jgi:hypothetical protein